jgi:hypothetical protein
VAPDLEERVLGFDARLTVAPEWDAQRRAEYLLRGEVAVPASIDATVWPSVFGPGAINPPDWTGMFSDLWDDLSALRLFLREQPDCADHRLVAFTVHVRRDGGLAEFMDAHGPRRNDGTDPQPFAEPTPAIRAASWTLLGYDLCGTFWVGGLSNCGYEPDERAGLAQMWGERLNEWHLCRSLEDAEALRAITDVRVPEHAPFVICGVWLLA